MNPLRKSHYFYVCSCKKKVFLLDSKLLVHKVNHMSPCWGLDELGYKHVAPLGLGGWYYVLVLYTYRPAGAWKRGPIARL